MGDVCKILSTYLWYFLFLVDRRINNWCRSLASFWSWHSRFAPSFSTLPLRRVPHFYSMYLNGYRYLRRHHGVFGMLRSLLWEYLYAVHGKFIVEMIVHVHHDVTMTSIVVEVISINIILLHREDLYNDHSVLIGRRLGEFVFLPGDFVNIEYFWINCNLIVRNDS